jgi:carboxypeptidase D
MADSPQIFNASHMAGYDQLHATHDMILRFMGMNFSAITDGTARIPSSVGNDVKPAFTESNPASAVPSAPSAKTPEQDKAMWEGTISLQFTVPVSQPRSLL